MSKAKVLCLHNFKRQKGYKQLRLVYRSRSNRPFIELLQDDGSWFIQDEGNCTTQMMFEIVHLSKSLDRLKTKMAKLADEYRENGIVLPDDTSGVSFEGSGVADEIDRIIGRKGK